MNSRRRGGGGATIASGFHLPELKFTTERGEHTVPVRVVADEHFAVHWIQMAAARSIHIHLQVSN